MTKRQSIPETVTELDPHLRHEAQKLGKVGVFFGTRENAALYIAGTIFVLVLSLLGALMFFDKAMRSDLATTIGAFGLAALGYIGYLIKK